MALFTHGPITEIPTDSPTVYAFRVIGHIDDDASEALAHYMNAAFDQHDKVNMLLDLAGFTGSDWDTLLDEAVIKSRLRALSHVERYAVVGAPDHAAKMITIMNAVIPVEAKAFDVADAAQAWNFVGAKPTATPEAAA